MLSFIDIIFSIDDICRPNGNKCFVYSITVPGSVDWFLSGNVPLKTNIQIGFMEKKLFSILPQQTHIPANMYSNASDALQDFVSVNAYKNLIGCLDS